MKKRLIIIILLLITIGCNKYNELNNLTIIKSIGITYQNDEYHLYAQIISSFEEKEEPKTEIIDVKGNSIDSLFNLLNKRVSKEIFFSHIDLLLLDFHLQNNNYIDIINYFTNHKEFRNDFICMLSSDIKKLLATSKYNEIEEMLNNKNNHKIIKISFNQLMQSYLQNYSFQISEIEYNTKIIHKDNYYYNNQKYERLENEKKYN